MRTSQPALPVRFLRLGLLSAAASALLYTASCSSDPQGTATTGDDHAHEPENSELADVIYESGATDEALAHLLDAKPVDNAAKAPVIDSPAEGAALEATPSPTFTWHTGTTATRAVEPGFRFAASKPAPARSPLAELFGPERAAHAHGDPVNGPAYWLVFSTEGDAKLLRVFTTKPSYQPGAEALKKLQGAGKPITLTVTAGVFDNNALALDGGPYQGKAVSFTVKQ